MMTMNGEKNVATAAGAPKAGTAGWIDAEATKKLHAGGFDAMLKGMSRDQLNDFALYFKLPFDEVLKRWGQLHPATTNVSAPTTPSSDVRAMATMPIAAPKRLSDIGIEPERPTGGMGRPLSDFIGEDLIIYGYEERESKFSKGRVWVIITVARLSAPSERFEVRTGSRSVIETLRRVASAGAFPIVATIKRQGNALFIE